MRVEDILREKGHTVVSVYERTRLKEAVQIMRKHSIGAIVATHKDGVLAGVISEREVVAALADDGRAALEFLICDLMLCPSPVVKPEDSVRDAMSLMTELRVRHLPVVVDSKVVGLLSIGDAVRARLSEKVAENLVLQDMARWPRIAAA
jgi:CBS domain-containing protein